MKGVDNTWSTERLKIAFDRFLSENGRLPTAPEVDRTDYLPSSRQIQRRFGGLKALRELLGYEVTDFGSGASRSGIATRGNLRAKAAERELEQELAQLFGEPFVHSEKYYGPGRNRADFIVYTMDGHFGIDVFTTETKHDLQKNVALKIDKYLDFPKSVRLFFVVVSQNLSEDEVQLACKGMVKIAKLPELEIVTPKGLFDEVRSLTPYIEPIGFVSIYDAV
ncbi:hypothetical protein A2917_01745 [Candidatus Nomurabacteria bacterium RIFCSPLOWO2_01_FULL_42_17]|uniref:Uncharacterized protein n=1 Tax=Candidatus Nomurabacteria bacterium RIFCSPLOWO2_01_FULL_42_17 TaxID=1801780 RepID=A0A1F6XLQ9_9BACT|nr:MAG: hypothetical protein A2917_01745 [Candidatus Nomurabacteria bacterium RIFCSPLOWO2_01_FULL_42_17]